MFRRGSACRWLSEKEKFDVRDGREESFRKRGQIVKGLIDVPRSSKFSLKLKGVTERIQTSAIREPRTSRGPSWF